jgi:hypothetical protein
VTRADRRKAQFAKWGGVQMTAIGRFRVLPSDLDRSPMHVSDAGGQPDIEFGGATVRDQIGDSLSGVGDWRVSGCVSQVGGGALVRQVETGTPARQT